MNFRERRFDEFRCVSSFHKMSIQSNKVVYEARLASALRKRFPGNVIIAAMSEPSRPLDAANPQLIHITIPVGMLQCNCTIIADPVTREALVVDPGDEVTRILELSDATNSSSKPSSAPTRTSITSAG